MQRELCGTYLEKDVDGLGVKGDSRCGVNPVQTASLEKQTI